MLRNLLFIKADNTEIINVNGIIAADWHVYIAEDIRAAKGLLEKYPFSVGIMPISYENGFVHEENIGFIVEQTQLSWVVILEQDCLKVPAVRTLIKEYCYDFHVLPVDLRRLLVTIGHAQGMASLAINPKPSTKFVGDYGMVGDSPRMRALFRKIAKAASTDVPVLITGENGTGKEQTAKAIHAHSVRADAPFVVVNCAALSASLIQSALFGHEIGAFTSAHKRRIGYIEAAVKGTLFLDEIGVLPSDMQVNLLRFLQEKMIYRLGNPKPISVDVRIIAATNIDLQQALREGHFREDLYYRLNVLHLHIPSLRQREDDLMQLAQFFFDQFAHSRKTTAKGFSEDARAVMNKHLWPGNVRELKNRIQRAILLSENRHITPADLELERRSPNRNPATLEDIRNTAEEKAIQAALRRNRNNIARAARELGVARVTLYRLMEKHGFNRNPSHDES